jgi:hypothetical protein
MNDGSDSVADAIAKLEKTILEPIVEGEVALRVRGMHDALVELEQQSAARSRIAPQTTGGALTVPTAVAEDIISEETRLQVQLRELSVAARALADRAAGVGPDEKRVQDEVDGFVMQARQFLTSLRQLEQAMQHARGTAASHD